MKKKLFLGLLAAAAVTFTACQKDEVINEVPQDQAIGFGTYVGRDAQTKASVTDLNAMKLGPYEGFGVFAYYTGNTDYDNSATSAFMHNVNVDYSTSWSYTNPKFWPGKTEDYKISFFAYAPFNKSGITVPSGPITGDPTINFTTPEMANQYDLLYATPVKNTYYNDDTKIEDGTVKFTFGHALSRIGLKAATARTDYKVTISSVVIKGKFKKSGTLNLNTGNWDNNTAAGDETSYTLNTFTNATNLSNTGGVAITPIDQYLMIIPTDLKTDPNQAVSVTVNYSYQYKVGDGPTNDPSDDVYAASVSVKETGTVGIDFVKGNAYTLMFTLDPLQPIQFSVNEVTGVTGWSPVNGTDTPVTTTLVP
ncbi:MAG: fimbrillin family protein [Bacteroidales bacterium]|nr:fimbrillin family protein [Bacteroidales bacterium]